MKTQRHAFTLIEVLVYISVLLLILGFGYAALYRCMHNATALRLGGEDIAKTLHAGEQWRSDVRQATGPIQTSFTDQETITVIPQGSTEVRYRYAEAAVYRRAGSGTWSAVLPNVKSSRIVSEERSGIKSCRWEVELRPRTKRIAAIQPLFTFIAVPQQPAQP